MGLFGKLFEKKQCDICGNEIGMLGNKKLEDGNCCKECNKKLSYWFSGRRHSTVDEIKQQLQLREENKEKVQQFNTTNSFDGEVRILIDENMNAFMAVRTSNILDENPDVISLDDVSDVIIDIDETKDEIYKLIEDEEGHTEKESYEPKRYEFSYMIRVLIHCKHPYIDEIEFDLNDDPIVVEVPNNNINDLFDGGTLHLGRSLPGSSYPPTLQQKQQNGEYARFESLAKEIKQALLHKTCSSCCSTPNNQPAVEDIMISCPWCGCKTHLTSSKECESCGGSLV